MHFELHLLGDREAASLHGVRVLYAELTVFLRKEVGRQGNSLENHFSVVVASVLKARENECFVRLAEECEFVEIVITLSLPR